MRQRYAFQLTCALSVLLLGAVPSSGALFFSDPVGDTFGLPDVAHDITSIGSVVTATDITFTVAFQAPISPPSAVASDSVVGYLDIDTDQDAGTGEVSNQSYYAGPSDLGMEFFLDLFSEEFAPGEVEVVDAATFFPVGTAPITFGSNSFSVSVPLTLLGDDDGNVNYGVIAGDFFDFSDEALNPGSGPAYSGPEQQIIPEPASLFIWLALAAFPFARPRRRRSAAS